MSSVEIIGGAVIIRSLYFRGIHKSLPGMILCELKQLTAHHPSPNRLDLVAESKEVRASPLESLIRVASKIVGRLTLSVVAR